MYHSVLSNTDAFQNRGPQKGWGRRVPCMGTRSRTRSPGSAWKQDPVGSLGHLRVGHPQAEQIAGHWDELKRPGLAHTPCRSLGFRWHIQRCQVLASSQRGDAQAAAFKTYPRHEAVSGKRQREQKPFCHV